MENYSNRLAHANVNHWYSQLTLPISTRMVSIQKWSIFYNTHLSPTPLCQKHPFSTDSIHVKKKMGERKAAKKQHVNDTRYRHFHRYALGHHHQFHHDHGENSYRATQWGGGRGIKNATSLFFIIFIYAHPPFRCYSTLPFGGSSWGGGSLSFFPSFYYMLRWRNLLSGWIIETLVSILFLRFASIFISSFPLHWDGDGDGEKKPYYMLVTLPWDQRTIETALNAGSYHRQRQRRRFSASMWSNLSSIPGTAHAKTGSVFRRSVHRGVSFTSFSSPI